MNKNFIRFFSSTILILVDFIIYFLPVLFLCTLSNNFILITYFFDNIYYLYYLIFKNKYLGPNCKLILFLISPLPILFYFPIGILISICYTIWITLIYPITLHIKKPHEPYFKISSTAAVMSSSSQSSFSKERNDMKKLIKKIDDDNNNNSNNLKEESLFLQPLKTALDLSSLIKEQCEIIIPQKVQNITSYQGSTTFDIKTWRIILIPIILPIYFIYTIPSALATFIILYFPMIYKFEYLLWKRTRIIGINRGVNLKNYNLISFLTVIFGSIIVPLLILLGNIIFLGAIITTSLGAIYKTLFKSFDEGLEFCSNVAMSVPESYLEMIFDYKLNI
ncbi:hypothetical protein Glove_21g276 [Diversispora epigaea]|uniref:Uncharacterized protein n=1 Tax=Diversispora epigaea TaxID=1348612 RepID=A0A397JU69_9GLOM|nr:hypothetical protein Glove_21g276 [Diversispora epigaea]